MRMPREDDFQFSKYVTALMPRHVACLLIFEALSLSKLRIDEWQLSEEVAAVR